MSEDRNPTPRRVVKRPYNNRSNNSNTSTITRKQEDNNNSIIVNRIDHQDNTPASEIIPEVPLEPNSQLDIIAMGGLGEIGKNTWVFRCKDQLLIIDAGLGFPNESMHGVDLVLPDLSYLIENRDKIVGMILTHGHEDHIGGIPNLLRAANVPVIYGPPLALGLVENKLKEHGLEQATKLAKFQPRQTIKLGCFTVTMIINNHSIPDSFAFMLQTPGGKVFHTGDFKIDHTPIDGQLTDVIALAEASKRGIDVFISDSTNAERPGHSPAEKTVLAGIEKAFMQAQKRILITTFASQVHRVGQIISLAQKYGRKVVILGRSMLNIALVSKKLGYMNFPEGLIIKAHEMSKYPQNKICVLSTGSQGETLSAMTRIANGTHRQISIIPGDTVVVSASPIPGNERSVANVINALCARGANVIHGRDANVHVSGHASQEEQKLMLNIIRPKHFMPSHGEYRMLLAHGKTAQDVLGLPDDKVFIMKNGDVLSIYTDKNCETSAKVSEYIPIGIMMVDSNNHSHAIPASIIDDRFNMSVQGLLSCAISINSKQELCTVPDINAQGLSFDTKQATYEFFEGLRTAVQNNWENIKDKSVTKLETKLQEVLEKQCKDTGYNPMVQVMTIKV